MRKTLLWFSLVFFLFSSFGDVAEAKRRRRRSRRHAPIINEKKLYERLGGAKSVSTIVDEWMRINLADPRISPSFSGLASQPERMARMRRNLGDQLCELADGPCTYKSQDAKKAHEEFLGEEERFLVFSDNLFKSMQKSLVPEREKNEMLGRIGELRADLTHDPSSPPVTKSAAQKPVAPAPPLSPSTEVLPDKALGAKSPAKPSASSEGPEKK